MGRGAGRERARRWVGSTHQQCCAWFCERYRESSCFGIAFGAVPSLFALAAYCECKRIAASTSTPFFSASAFMMSPSDMPPILYTDTILRSEHAGERRGWEGGGECGESVGGGGKVSAGGGMRECATGERSVCECSLAVPRRRTSSARERRPRGPSARGANPARERCGDATAQTMLERRWAKYNFLIHFNDFSSTAPSGVQFASMRHLLKTAQLREAANRVHLSPQPGVRIDFRLLAISMVEINYIFKIIRIV